MNVPSNSSKLSKEQIVELNRSFAASDAEACFEVSDEFEQFNQMNDMFTRAFWDDTVKSNEADGFFNSYRMEFAPRNGQGFNMNNSGKTA